jgi:hypothetical protein
MRVIHQRFAALISAVLVVFSGNITHGGKVMSIKKQENSTPRVYTSKSGRRYARTTEVICSASARAEISRNAQISKEKSKTETRNK